MKIIGICGFKNSGKDTLANILIQNHNFVKLSFATILKDIVSIMFSWNRDMLEGINVKDREKREEIDEWWAKKLNIPHLTPRWILQYFGTDLFRNNFHQDIWIICLEKKIYELNKNIVITDCRFPNEINLIKKLNGKIVHIYREPLPYWFNDLYSNKIDCPPNNLHSSEWSWIKNNKFDITINNNKTIKDLDLYIDNIINL
jgi:hypothetical protein